MTGLAFSVDFLYHDVKNCIFTLLFHFRITRILSLALDLPHPSLHLHLHSPQSISNSLVLRYDPGLSLVYLLQFLILVEGMYLMLARIYIT